MTEIKLEKRYPHSRMEDITDAFMRGYQQGKEDEHRWWSNHCANCKDAEQTEPQTERKCVDCKFLTYMFGKTWCNIKCDNPHDEVCDRWTAQTDCAWK